MAIKKTRQRQRGGPYSKFDKAKTLPREFQIVESGDPNAKDGRAVYIAFEAGEPKRLSTYEDMQEDIDNATEEIQETLTAGVDKKIKEADAAIASAKSATTKANTATTNANKATDSANKAADNANKAVENIQSKVGINDKQPSDVTTYSGNKIETEFLKKNGNSSKTTVTFEVATQRANIQPQDTLEVAFGKLAKFCGDLKSHAFAAPVNNLAGTNPDLALAAPMGKELKNEIDALNSTLTTKRISPFTPSENFTVYTTSMFYCSATKQIIFNIRGSFVNGARFIGIISEKYRPQFQVLLQNSLNPYGAYVDESGQVAMFENNTATGIVVISGAWALDTN